MLVLKKKLFHTIDNKNTYFFFSKDGVKRNFEMDDEGELNYYQVNV